MGNSKYIYGKNPVREELKIISTGDLFIRKSVENSTVIDIIKKAKAKGINVNFIDNESFDKFFGGNKNHQGIALKIKEEYIEKIDEKQFLASIQSSETKYSIIVILDGITDVGNFGAVLRSSLLFGVDAVILPKNNSSPVNDAVIKSSSGAALHQTIIYVTNLARIIEELKEAGYWIYASDKSGTDLSQVRFHEKIVLVFGSESAGIRPLVIKKCDVVAAIPTNDKLDSLNLSVSAGIVLYEINRQKLNH